MKIFSLFVLFAVSSVSLFSAPEPQATLNPFPTFRGGFTSPITTTITYVSEDLEGSNLSPCQALISIDGSQIGVYNKKPCSLELLAALQKDYKLVIAQAMSTKKQADQKILAAYRENAARFSPVIVLETFFPEISDRIVREEFSKNPLARDFFETFEMDIYALHGAEEFTKKMSSFLRNTVAYEMEVYEYYPQHEDTYHHLQKAYEVYISTFVISGSVIPMNQSGLGSPIKTTIFYMSQDEQKSAISPCVSAVYIDGEVIIIGNKKPCSSELLAALKKDYKLVIAQAMSARKQVFEKILDLDDEDAAPALVGSDIWHEFEVKMLKLAEDEFSKNPLIKDFFETFEYRSCELELEEPTVASFIDTCEIALLHEDYYHHIQKAFEGYISTFLGHKN